MINQSNFIVGQPKLTNTEINSEVVSSFFKIQNSNSKILTKLKLILSYSINWNLVNIGRKFYKLYPSFNKSCQLIMISYQAFLNSGLQINQRQETISRTN
ncbi:unnamed protein product [Paramecium sonneborni]|uniref:Uncharacterized protein n=1 Tax=Paramecium sonneborni TaxID=65129 RepID=A0A8S1R8C6_9CILI|nr:unnamed protein product [Paramecium sonneborni]